MPKYRERTIVTAEQWFPGKKIPGVIGSEDGTMALFKGQSLSSLVRWDVIAPGDYIVTYSGGLQISVGKARFEEKYEYIGGE